MQIIGQIFGTALRGCYAIVGNYALAIVVFTLLTKVLLFPVGMWTQRNSIKMLELTPELNRLKIAYFGDGETIAEETQKLYKQRKYHPLAGLVPLVIQLVLLLGVIGAVRQLLDGTESMLSVYPSQKGGITLLCMPLAAGAAALALGFAQNRFNPLQHEQTPASQWSSNGLSIAISLSLAAFVPVGVGLYWICSNLFTIPQQLLLNLVMPAKKYVDYEALERSRKELAEMNSLSADVSKEDKKREKEDYKRFFSVANKHLVFYSEKSGFYKYFQDVIEYLLARSNVIIHYVTSDPKDQVFTLAKSQPRLRPYYIGEKRLITLMMKMDADMVVMTMPDLDNYHIKRSYVRKDVEYVYMFHGLFTGAETVRSGAVDHFDTLLVTDPGIEVEIKGYNKVNGVPDQRMVPCGYGLIDRMAAEYEAMEKKEHEIKTVLVAPSWQKGNIIESCLHELVEPLLEAGYNITVRPHPQYIRRCPQKLERIMVECGKYPAERFRFQLDFSSNESVYQTDILVTDWSGIGYEYALATKKPVLFINTPRKIVNEKWSEENKKKYNVNADIRGIIGIALEPGDVRKDAVNAAERLTGEREKWELAIEYVRRERMYHFGESGKYGAKYILERLTQGKEHRC